MMNEEKNEFNQPIGFIVPNWQPAHYPGQNLLQGIYCQLEKLEVDNHGKQLLENLSHHNQGKSWTYLPHGPFENGIAFTTGLIKLQHSLIKQTAYAYWNCRISQNHT